VTEQSLRDHMIRAAGKPAIEAAEGQSKSAPLLRRQIVGRPSTGSVRQGAQQTQIRAFASAQVS
jgi:hypothetical protein